MERFPAPVSLCRDLSCGQVELENASRLLCSRADHPPSGPPQTGLGLKNGLLFPLAPSDLNGLHWCSRTCAAWTLVFQLLFELLRVPGAQEENLGSLPAQILYTFHLLRLWPTAEEVILKDAPLSFSPRPPPVGDLAGGSLLYYWVAPRYK